MNFVKCISYVVYVIEWFKVVMIYVVVVVVLIFFVEMCEIKMICNYFLEKE